MEEGAGGASHWELSKENIQPLKQGRKAAVLSVALDESASRKLNIERHGFEEELRTYSGDDPLDVWFRYVMWVEQNYPKGGKEGNFLKLIEKCIMALNNDAQLMEKYSNDPRFLELWVKYANLAPRPIEIYQALEAKGLCSELADFYMNWAWELEKLGNFKRANDIYQRGLQKGAKPFDVLDDAHKKFQMRVARATVDGQMTDQEPDAPEQQRMALSSLKAQGKKHQVATERVANVIGPAGRVATTAPTTNKGGPVFQIFQDNGKSGEGVHNDGPGGALPVQTSIVNKENVKDASRWTKAKTSQRTTSIVPVEDLNHYQMPAFSLHADGGVQQPTTTPAKLPQTSSVLSVRKAEFDAWDVPLFISEPFDPKVQAEYCKSKVYCGTEEFCFEELRAAKYFKKMKEEREKKKEERERNARLEEMEDVLKKQQDMLARQEEMILQLTDRLTKQDEPKASNLSHLRAPMPNSVRKGRDGRENMSQNMYQDSWICVNKSVNVDGSCFVNASHLLEESTTNALLQCQPATSNLSSKESSIVQEPSLSIPDTKPVSQDNSAVSGNSSSRGLNVTEPTINTKLAMNMMNEMWSASLFKDDIQQDVNELETEGPECDDDPPAPAIGAFTIFQDVEKMEVPEESVPATPFAIFSDSAEGKREMVTSNPAQPFTSNPAQPFNSNPAQPFTSNPAQPFTIFTEETNQAASLAQPNDDPNNQYLDDEDTENQPPAGYTAKHKEFRQTSGILQPATNVPVLPLEDQEMEEEPKKCEAEAKSSGVKEHETDELDDFVPLNGVDMADFTLKMPNDANAFANMAKCVSTPGLWSLGMVPQATTNGDDFTMAITRGNNHIPLIEENKEDSGELMPPPIVQLPPFSSPTGHIKPACLSPIMEASREYRSSSSSSSSGYSTTLGGHGTTHHTGLSTIQFSRSRHNSHTQAESELENVGLPQTGDFTKSGYFADKSRGESLAESRPPVKAIKYMDDEDDLTFDPRQAARMLMDVDEMPPSIGESTRIDMRETRHVAASKKLQLPERINPFDEEILQVLLLNLENPVDERGGFIIQQGKLPVLKPNIQITLGSEMFHVRRLRGEGAYAKVYQASTLDPMNVTILPTFDDSDEDDDEDEDDEKQMILKIQKPACPWEFYICHELRERLKGQGASVDLLDSVMRINRGYFYSSGSILVNQYHKYGSLLDIVNGYKQAGKPMPEEIVIYFMIEVLTILEALHSCSMIHADIKPDNLLVRESPEINPLAETPAAMFSSGPKALKLIDFGRSIDMKLLPDGTTFTEKVTTDGFTCCEMRDGRPWTYQTDLYGAVVIAHTMLFGTYLEVKKSPSGQWELKGSALKRYWNKNLWETFFATMLNIPSCSAIPSLSKLKADFMQCFFNSEMKKEFNTLRKQLFTIMIQRK